MEEERVREIARDEYGKMDANFHVDREMHYRHHQDIEEIDSKMVSHLDQHKWVDGLIVRWRSAAGTVGTWVLILILGALFTLLGWYAAVKIKVGF